MTTHHLLALETSGHTCSVAVLSRVHGATQAYVERVAGPRGHARHVLALAHSVLAQAQLVPAALSAIAFGQGPGSFTGLRLACGVAQGLALALDIPVVPVDSLGVIAARMAGANAQGTWLVLQDARMHEVYAAAYRADQGHWVCVQAPVLLACSAVAAWVADQAGAWGAQGAAAWVAVGSALQAYPQLEQQLAELGASVQPQTTEPDAETLVRLGEQAWLAGKGLDAALASPAYVRNKVAYTTIERAGGLGGNPAAEPTVQLHEMTAADLDEVLAIERQVQAVPWSRQNFTDALLAGHAGWILRRMGAVLGFALLMDAPDMAHLLLIGIRPDVQRQGLGSRLLQACTAHVRQTGLPALTLEVRASNEPAILFYESHGFSRHGVRRGYYPGPNGREDAWIMTLPVGATA